MGRQVDKWVGHPGAALNWTGTGQLSISYNSRDPWKIIISSRRLHISCQQTVFFKTALTGDFNTQVCSIPHSGVGTQEWMSTNIEHPSFALVMQIKLLVLLLLLISSIRRPVFWKGRFDLEKIGGGGGEKKETLARNFRDSGVNLIKHLQV